MKTMIYMEPMVKNKLYVFIYKTSVKNKADKEYVANVLDPVLGKTNWTIDLTDEDKVLRVESRDPDAGLIEDLLTAYAFFCEQMHY
jgi:hypothetical protein